MAAALSIGSAAFTLSRSPEHSGLLLSVASGGEVFCREKHRSDVRAAPQSDLMPATSSRYSTFQCPQRWACQSQRAKRQASVRPGRRSPEEDGEGELFSVCF